MADDDSGERPKLREVNEWTGGFSWFVYPEGRGMRTSHALQTEAGVWIVEPIDADRLDERVTELGEVAGVLVIHDRHTRDAVEVARRHDVAVYVPDWMNLTLEKLNAVPESVGVDLPGTNYTIHRLLDTDDWEEAVLVNETTNTMLVPEALGTIQSFRKNDHEIGVHPALDEPPARLMDWTPDRLLVGHGMGIHTEANAKMRAALDDE